MIHKTGPMIKWIGDRIKARVDGELREAGLTFSQTYVLRYLSRRGGSMPQKDIVSYMNVSHPTVVGLVSRLEKNGFVVIERDPRDGRSRIVKMTQKAVEALDEDTKHGNDIEDWLLNGFNESERKQFSDFLNRIYNNVSSDDCCSGVAAEHKGDSKAGTTI